MNPPSRIPWAWPLVAVLLAAPLLGFTAFRAAFLVQYAEQFADAGFGEIAGAFLAGVRFDAAVIALAVGPFAAAVLALSPWRRRRAVLWVAFTLAMMASAALLVLLGADLPYFAFAGRHVSFEVFAMHRDAGAIAAMAAAGYALYTLAVLAGIAALLAGAVWAARRSARRAYAPASPWHHAGQTLMLVVVLVLAARGGWQVKPLAVGDAFRGRELALGHLALNGAFTAKAALLGRRPRPLHFMPEAEATAQTRDLLGLEGAPQDARYPLLPVPPVAIRQGAAPGSPAGPRKNLVIIAVESFSAQMTGVLGGAEGVTPEFDRRAREGVLFRNFFANGTRSVEGVSAILSGYPALPGTPAIGSALEQHRQGSLARVLAESGYSTLFIHGAFRGSMWLDSYAERSGFQRYIAQEDFPDYEAKSDGTWGIFDHHTLERLHAELAAAEKPVFAFLFTLGPHTPFRLPGESFRRFPQDSPDAELRNAFAYTDHALGRFFALAERSAYWRDTVFVVTADHNMGRTLASASGPLDRRAAMWIPLAILAPGDPRLPAGTVLDTLGSQADIAPTVLDLLGLSGRLPTAGRSLWGESTGRFAFHAWANHAGWQEGEWFLVADRDRPLALHRLGEGRALSANLLNDAGALDRARPALHRARAYWQTVNNLLLENRVVPPR